MIAWLAATGRWPTEMPHSLDGGDLGLSDGDIEAAASKKAAVEKQRQDQSRQITLDGRVLDASPENYNLIVDSIALSIDEGLLSMPAEMAGLAPMPPGPPRGPRAGGRNGITAARRPRLSDMQAAAVGLAGEIVAFAWLRRHYLDITDVFRRSGYRNFVVGDEGDDSPGYDFEVLTPRRRLLFEVKASVGNRWEFELTDTEIRAAGGLRRGDRYHILFVSSVLNSDERAIHLLPNPFSTDAAGLYRTMGAGLRLGFELA